MAINQQDFKRFQAQVQACTSCDYFRQFGYYKFKREKCGTPSSPIWIVGVDPRKIDTNPDADFWRGKSAVNLRNPIEKIANQPLEDLVYLTDIVKCQRKTKKLNGQVCQKCVKKWFRRELVLLKPQYILALGEGAGSAIGRFKMQLQKRGLKELIILPHPSPANGTSIKFQYPKNGWDDYRDQMSQIILRWLRQSKIENMMIT